MRETLELRIPEDEARRFLRPEEGTLLGDSVRKVRLPLADERVQYIGDVARAFIQRGRVFFTSWNITRRYTEEELRTAELFNLWPSATFEPAGEDCGTEYDESTACPRCGAGARQVSDLVLDLRRVPKGADIARTIADELLISSRLAEAIRARGFTGAGFRPVRQAGRKGAVSSDWHQLVVTSAPVEVSAPTVTGKNPFDLDDSGEYRCPLGHVAGLNFISELSVSRTSYDGSDLTCTRQLFGRRGGLIRPRPCLLVSSRLRALLGELGIRRLEFEVVHLV